MRPHVLLVKLDRAISAQTMAQLVRRAGAGARWLTLLCRPEEAAALEGLRGVDEVRRLPRRWSPAGEAIPQGADTDPLGEAGELRELVDGLRAASVDRAVLLLANGQDPLPAAGVLEGAAVAAIATVTGADWSSLTELRPVFDRSLGG